jgi:uncharacterized MAPEG superfamily protein
MDMAQYPALPIYALFATGLCLFSMALDGASGLFRFKTKTTLNREDATTTSRGAEIVADERPEVARANRAWRNAFANIVPFLVVGFLYVLTGARENSALVYFGVFAAARVIHAIAYLAGKQPWRSLAFVVGQLATLGLAVQVLVFFRRG